MAAVGSDLNGRKYIDTQNGLSEPSKAGEGRRRENRGAPRAETCITSRVLRTPQVWEKQKGCRPLLEGASIMSTHFKLCGTLNSWG